MKGQPEDPSESGIQSRSHPDTENRSDSSTGQIYEPKAFAEDVQALEHAKAVLAGRCEALLASPVQALLDVVKTWDAVHKNGQDETALDDVMQALVALEDRTDSAVVLLHEFTVVLKPAGLPATEPPSSDVVRLGTLLRNLSLSTKHILAQLQFPNRTPRFDIEPSIQSAVQEFSALNKLHIEDIVSLWASYGMWLPAFITSKTIAHLVDSEAEKNGTVDARSSPPSPTQQISLSTLKTGQSVDLPSPKSEEPESQDGVQTENALGSDAYARHEKGGSIDDIQEAIDHFDKALALCTLEHQLRPIVLFNAGQAYYDRFNALNLQTDLETAIAYFQGSMDSRPSGSPRNSVCLNNLASALRIRFGQSGQISDLEQAIIYHRDDLDSRPPGHPDRHISLNNLAVTLQIRYDHLGQIADLEEAIIHHREALELRPLGHPGRSRTLGNLAGALHIRFNRMGQMQDLEQTIIYQREALDLRPLGHPGRLRPLNNLASALQIRFDQLGQIADLEQAIVYHQEGLGLRPAGHPARAMALDNFAVTLATRFRRLGEISDLERAILYHREALELRPLGHPKRQLSLDNLATALQTRFTESSQIADLEQVITYYQEALGLRRPGHPRRSTTLHNLGSALRTRFDRLCQIADLENSIIYQKESLDLHPPGHPDRHISLDSLASGLRTRFEKLNQMADLDEAVKLLWSGTNDISDTPKHRYTSVSRLIALLEVHYRPLLLEAYEIALNLLQLVLAVYPDVELRREALGNDKLSPFLAMSAAAHAIEQGQPNKAVEMLEQGRAMLWSNFRGYRQPVDAVLQVDAALAHRFKATSEQLEALATSSQPGSRKSSSESRDQSAAASEARWAQQRQLSLERDEVIQQIRQLPGFEYFLQAVPFHELQNAATEGPVIVVNVARQRSDAIILRQHDAPIVLPLLVDGQNRQATYLAILDLSNLLSRERGKPGFSDTLENSILTKLERFLVTLVLEKLEELGVPQQSRIWWCPTSALCALPIHAAGQLPNRYISSYTPTLSALITARASYTQEPSASLSSSDSQTLLLTVIHPGQPPKTDSDPDDRLLTVLTERNVIAKAGGPTRVLSLTKTDATRQGVLAALPDHPWVHFACHGRLNTSEPFRSAFELEDAPLSLSDLIHARLPDANFAFLAACDSATSGGNSNTPDESLHLAAAVQFCGVRSVVGTLWPMADEDGPRVAQVFYRHMFKENGPRKSAEALHKVVMTMRKQAGPWAKAKDEGELLQRWANYIHIGA
ncbi:hypothetical protein HWV62_43339 [Athelia sp. TMB]|nr:hypothetical protein HWV62_43339 [Athelia sp. TMB]